MTEQIVRVGMVSTSWWAELMYLPALQNHPDAVVTAVCGRDPDRTRAFAQKWDIPNAFVNYTAMIESGLIDAVIIASVNHAHHDMVVKAADAGLHMLCEKPLAMTVEEAEEMTQKVKEAGVKANVAFTYRFMPTARYVKQLIDEGYIGTPYHLNLRYYTGSARAAGYEWRFDVDKAGAGLVGDIGSHFMYLAQWYFGEIESVMCMLSHHIPRANKPDGSDYPRGDDGASILLQFKNGAQGAIVASGVCYEGDHEFGQTHPMEFHGSGGTLYSYIDWDKTQWVRGARAGEGMLKDLPIPDDIWGTADRDSVMETYKDTFRNHDFMVRGLITAIIEDTEPEPTFDEALHIQRVIQACMQSAETGRRVRVDEVQ